MKISRRVRAQARAQARKSGATPTKQGGRKEYSSSGQRMKKTLKYVWEPGSLVTVLPQPAYYGKIEETTGIVIGPYGAGYFDVLTSAGEIIQAPGKRLRKAD